MLNIKRSKFSPAEYKNLGWEDCASTQGNRLSEYSNYMLDNKHLRIEKWHDEISKFSSENGFDFVKRTKYHMSIFSHEKRIDFYPVAMRFHNIKTNERGDVPQNLREFLNKCFAGETRV